MLALSTLLDKRHAAVTTTLGYGLTSLQTMSGTALTHNYVYTDTATGARSVVSDTLSAARGSYSYDQADRLTGYTAGLGQYSYAYDGDGLRQSKALSGTTEAYTWDTAEGLPQLLQDGSTRYIMGPSGLPLEQVSVTGTVLYYYQNQLGSTRALLTGAYAYNAFGTLAYKTGSASNPFGYAGQYTDPETGFQCLQARYYDPATSQFLTRDPLVAVTGQPYAYAADDPLNLIDPFGTDPCSGFDPGCWGRNALQFGGDVATGAGQDVGDMVQGTAQTAQVVYNSLPPGFAFAGISKPYSMLGPQYDWQAFASQWQQNVQIGCYLSQHPDALVNGFIDPYRDALRSGHPGKALGRAAVDVGSVFVGIEEIRALSSIARSNVIVAGVGERAAIIGDIGSGNAYSVAYQTTLGEWAYPVRAERYHFRLANQALLADMAANPEFAERMESLIPGLHAELITRRGNVIGQSPALWTWHHATEPGVMQLMPRAQHRAAGALQRILHPGGIGGWDIGAIPTSRGARYMTLAELLERIGELDDELVIYASNRPTWHEHSEAIASIEPDDYSLPLITLFLR